MRISSNNRGIILPAIAVLGFLLFSATLTTVVVVERANQFDPRSRAAFTTPAPQPTKRITPTPLPGSTITPVDTPGARTVSQGNKCTSDIQCFEGLYCKLDNGATRCAPIPTAVPPNSACTIGAFECRGTYVYQCVRDSDNVGVFQMKEFCTSGCNPGTGSCNPPPSSTPTPTIHETCRDNGGVCMSGRTCGNERRQDISGTCQTGICCSQAEYGYNVIRNTSNGGTSYSCQKEVNGTYATQSDCERNKPQGCRSDTCTQGRVCTESYDQGLIMTYCVVPTPIPSKIVSAASPKATDTPIVMAKPNTQGEARKCGGNVAEGTVANAGGGTWVICECTPTTCLNRTLTSQEVQQYQTSGTIPTPKTTTIPVVTLPPTRSCGRLAEHAYGMNAGLCYQCVCIDASCRNTQVHLTFCQTSTTSSPATTRASTPPPRVTTTAPIPSISRSPSPSISREPVSNTGETLSGPLVSTGPCYCRSNEGINYECRDQSLCCSSRFASWAKNHESVCNVPPTRPISTSNSVSRTGTTATGTTCSDITCPTSWTCKTASTSSQGQVASYAYCVPTQTPPSAPTPTKSQSILSNVVENIQGQIQVQKTIDLILAIFSGFPFPGFTNNNRGRNNPPTVTPAPFSNPNIIDSGICSTIVTISSNQTNDGKILYIPQNGSGSRCTTRTCTGVDCRHLSNGIPDEECYKHIAAQNVCEANSDGDNLSLCVPGFEINCERSEYEPPEVIQAKRNNQQTHNTPQTPCSAEAINGIGYSTQSTQQYKDNYFETTCLQSTTGWSPSVVSCAFLGQTFQLNSSYCSVLQSCVEQKLKDRYTRTNDSTFDFPSGEQTLSIDLSCGTKAASYSLHNPNHYCRAIDINVHQNSGNLVGNPVEPVIDMPPELVGIMEECGILWGGRYTAAEGIQNGCDPMEFSYAPSCFQ